MKKIISLFSTILFALNLNAQVSKTDGPTSSEPMDVRCLIGTDNDAFYIFRKNKGDGNGKMAVQRYNKKTLTKEWETDISIKNEDIEILDKGAGNVWLLTKFYTTLKGNKLYIFIPAINTNPYKAVLLLKCLDTKGTIVSDKEIVSVPLSKPGYQTKNTFVNLIAPYTKFRFSTSPDSTKTCFWLESTAGVEAKQKGRRVSIIDFKAPEIHADTFLLQDAAGAFDNNSLSGNLCISNTGKIAFGYIHYDKEKDSRSYHILLYDPISKAEKTCVPSFETAKQVVMEDSRIDFFNNKILFSAILTDDSKEKNKKKNSSIYISQIDAGTAKQDYEITQYFSEEWRVKYDPAKTSASVKTGHSNYDFVFTPADGGGYIISAFKQGGWSRPSVAYVTDDAIITKVNVSGKIEWIKTMPISVEAANYVNCAYLNNKMYYIFNDDKDNEKNIDLTKVESSKQTITSKSGRGKNVNTTCITIDPKGNMQRTLICNNKDVEFYPLDKTAWVDKNKILLYFMSDSSKEFFSSLSLQ